MQFVVQNPLSSMRSRTTHPLRVIAFANPPPLRHNSTGCSTDSVVRPSSYRLYHTPSRHPRPQSAGATLSAAVSRLHAATPFPPPSIDERNTRTPTSQPDTSHPARQACVRRARDDSASPMTIPALVLDRDGLDSQRRACLDD
ncbi:hypothetical protein C8T65DRAFT_301267 [Cerioporus squamosus]|nr:hypothetical protein C8T65DRAFT_301267 [Cerioporus squamosus]